MTDLRRTLKILVFCACCLVGTQSAQSQPCSTAADCGGDGLFCNGTETCSLGLCILQQNPCTGILQLGSCVVLDAGCDEELDMCVDVPDSSLCAPGLVCTPSGECIERGLDHFKCYEAEGDELDVLVSLEDQFGFDPDVWVGEPKLFCNPVDKNGEGIFDPTAHLTGYGIGGDDDDDDDDRMSVSVLNQFGEQELIIDEPELLLVPSEKNGVPSILDLDHFKCYGAEGDPLNMIVSLVDQFVEEPEEVLLGEPELFCNSVNKDDLGILDPEAELTCYGIEEGDDDDDDDDDDVEREVFVSNQFGGQFLEIGESKLLCVPSEKLGEISCPCWSRADLLSLPSTEDPAACILGPDSFVLFEDSVFCEHSYSVVGLSCITNRFDCPGLPDLGAIESETTEEELEICTAQLRQRCAELGLPTDF